MDSMSFGLKPAIGFTPCTPSPSSVLVVSSSRLVLTGTPSPRMRTMATAPGCPLAVTTSTPGARPSSAWSSDVTGAAETCSDVTDDTAPVSSRRSVVPYPMATTCSSSVACAANANSRAASWSGTTVTAFDTERYPMRVAFTVCGPAGTFAIR